MAPQTVLITGGKGFLGNILSQALGQRFVVLSLGRGTSNDIVVDLSKQEPTIPQIHYVIHAAGKAHIYPRTDAERRSFFETNVQGTANLLTCLERTKPMRFVFISTVSVYGLDEGNNISELSPLTGQSPYAMSKIQSESLVESFCEKLQIPYLILRLPLIAGPNPPGNLGKMIEAIKRGRYFRIADGSARKSAVWGLDIALLIQRWLDSNNPVSGIYNLTDGEHPSFYEWEIALRRHLHLSQSYIISSIPISFAKLLGIIGDLIPASPFNTHTVNKITKGCTYSDDKARKELGWIPTSVMAKVSQIIDQSHKTI